MCVLFNKRVFFSSVFHLCVLFFNKRTVAEYALPKVEDVLIGVKGRSISEWLKKCYSGAQGCHRSRYTENNSVYRLFPKFGIFGSKGGCFAYCPKICKTWHFCKIFSKNGGKIKFSGGSPAGAGRCGGLRPKDLSLIGKSRLMKKRF